MPRRTVAALLAFLPFLAQAALPTDAEVRAVLDKHLIATKQARGVAVALVDANGIRVVTAGEARAGQPLAPSHLFEIGSLTKTFTGLLLAIADARGEAKLDDPVEKFLPAGTKLRDPAGEPIRMVDLATHRSGLPRLAQNMLPRNPLDPYADYTEQDLLDFVKDWTPIRARNASFEYSNIGYGLLGYALTRAAKAPGYDALLAERVLTPLGMADTTADPGKLTHRLAQPHNAAGEPTPPWALPLAHAGAGAIRATAGDIGKYLEAAAGLKDTPLAKAFTLAMTMRETGPGRINPIGLAWLRIPFGGREFMNHDGGTFGSSSSLLVDRAAKEGVFVVANTSVRLQDVALHLMDRRHELKPREFPRTVAVTPAVVARYAGTYRLTPEMNVVIRATGTKLTAQATGQGEFEIFPESETKFFARVAPIVITFDEIAGEGERAKSASFVLEQGGAKRRAQRVGN